MEAVKAAGVPKELQAAALELAVADLRASAASGKKGPAAATKRTRAPGGASKAGTKRPAPRQRPDSATEDSVLSRLPDESTFLKAIEKETGVSTKDLADIFHIDDGRLELKIASKSLGANKRAQTQTVTALLAGAVFAGTSERKLSFGEINRVCDAKHCFDSGNAAASIKATPGYSSLGAGKAQAIVTKSGWQDEFAKASRRVLGKPEPKS